MPRLPFITFEGSEGCGKSTQVQRLAARLKRAGVLYLVTREPGGTPIGETIRELLQFAPHGGGMTPQTELLLFEASRSQLVRETIKPALESGLCVVADRFFDSTTVYQGVARKLDQQIVERLNAFAVGDFVPDITFVLDIDAETARSRLKRTVRRPDRMEQESTEFYDRVRTGYRELAIRDPHRIILIDGTRPADEVENEIWEMISNRFPQPESKSRRIVIEQIRNIEHALQMRASRGRHKVAIISDADRLQPQAANAFLKTLEEPPKDSLLLLLSALPEALPDTIVSRCIAIPLALNDEDKNKPEEEEVVELIQEANHE